MRQVFVSHNSVDVDAATRLRAAILAHDPDDVVHLSSDAEAGAGAGNWVPWIRRTIQHCDVVVFVGSEASVASAWCSAELGMALLLARPVLAVYVGDEPIISPLVDRHNALPLSSVLPRVGSLLDDVGADPRPGVAAVPPDVVPYPGLAPLTDTQEGVLFGRSKELARILTAFDTPRPLLVLAGPSGSGKSSLVRAGMVPVLRRDGWQVASPVQPRDLATQLPDPPTEGSDRSVVVVDQAEELAELGDEARDRIIAWVDQWLRAGARVVVVVRSEFRSSVALWDVPTTDHYVPFMGPEALYDVIRGPAKAVQLEVPEDLVDRLVNETRTGSALPLLAYTLNKLWHQRDRGDHRLRMATLDALGGVQGVLEGQASSALQAATAGNPARREDVLATLSRLASPTHRPPTRSPRRVRTFDDEERGWLDAFEQVGLVAFRTSHALDDRLAGNVAPTGEDLVDVTHEALFEWDLLARTIDARRQRNRDLEAIESAALHWNDGKRADDTLLVAGDRLGLAIEEHTGTSDSLMGDFVDASRRADFDRRTRRWLSIGAATAAVIAIVAAGFFVDQRNRARTAREDAVVAQQAAEDAQRDEAAARRDAEQARVVAQSVRVAAQAKEAIDTERDLALLAAVAGWRIDPNADTEGALVDVLATPEGPLRWFARPGPDWASLVLLSPATGAVIDEDVQPGLVDLATGAVTSRPVVDAQVPGGTTFEAAEVVAADDGRTALVRGRVPPTGSAVGWVDMRAEGGAVLVGHATAVTAVVGTSSELVFGDASGAVLTVSRTLEGAGTPRVIAGHTGEVLDIALSPDGAWLASTSGDGVMVQRRTGGDWGQPVLAGAPPGDGRLPSQVAFSTGSPVRLFAAGSAPQVRQWGLRDGTFVEGTPLGPHGSVVTDMVADPVAPVLTTAGFDGTLQQWSTTRLAPMGDPLVAHDSAIEQVVTTGDGIVVSTARDADGAPEAVLWDLAKSRIVARDGVVPDGWATEDVVALVAGSGPIAAVTSTGEVLATSNAPGPVPTPAQRAWRFDGGPVVVEQRVRADRQVDQPPVWLWQTDPWLQHPVDDRGDGIGYDAVAVGRCLAAGARDDVVAFIDIGGCGDPPTPITLPSGAVRELAISPDGGRLLVVRRADEQGGQVVEEWEVATGRVRRSLDLPGVTATSAIWVDEDRVAIGRDLGAQSEVVDLSGQRAPVALGTHDDAVWWLAWDPVRGQVYSAGQDGRLSQTDLATGRVVGDPRIGARSMQLNDTDAEVFGLRLLDDGGVVVALHGSRVVAWEADPARLAARACEAADRPLTPTERTRLGIASDLVVCD